MASVNRIDSVYDVAAIAAEQKRVEELVRASIEQIKQARTQSIDLNVNAKGFDQYNKKIKELEKTLSGLQKASNDAVRASTLLAKQKQAEAQAAEKANKASISELKLREQINKESAKSAEQLKKSNAELKNQNAITEKGNAEKAKEAKLVDQVTDDYLQLSKAYNEAALKAKNYVLRLGENHPIAVQAVKDANDLGNVLKRLDASVGQTQRNVGNYKSAFDGLGFSFTQVARELPSLSISFQQFALAISNNLPMVADEISKAKKEIATFAAEGKVAPSILQRVGKALLSWQVGLSVGIALLTAYAGVLKNWVVELVSGKENTDKLSESQKKLSDAIREVNAARQDSIRANKQALDPSLNPLQRDIDLAEAAGASESKLLALRIRLAQEKKAIADNEIANQISIAEQEKETQDLQKTGLEAVKTALDTAEIEYFSFTSQIVKLSQERLVALAAERDGAVKSLDKQIEAAKAGQAAAQERADAYRNALQNQFDADTELQKLRLQQGKKYNDDERRAAFELFKFRLELAIEEQKAIVAISQGAGRNTARARQTQLERELISGIAKFELTEKDVTRSRIKLISEKRAEDEKEANRNLITDLIGFVQEEREILLQSADETGALLLERETENQKKMADEKVRLKKLEQDDLINSFTREQHQIEENTSLALKAEAGRYKESKDGKEKHEANKLKIENDGRRKSIEAEIKYYEALILLSDLSSEDQKKAIESLHNLRIRLRAEDISEEEKAKDKKIQFEKERAAALKSLGSELAGLTFDIFTNAIERQKNEVQDLIDLLEKQKQKDIELANQTITNQQEKADAIAVIEARAAAKRQQLELRQRQLDQQKARFEKARAVTEIIQSTSIAVVKALGAFPGPAGIALAAIIGALGAVQIARVLAQPIPRYKDGTENHPGGPMIVGDGGRAEGIQLPDGTTYKTPATDTLMTAPAGTKVFKDYNNMPLKPVTEISVIDTTGEIRAMRYDVVRAIKKIPQPIIHAERAWTQAHKIGSSYRNYLNRSI